jgi:hypothetical protein
MRSMADVQVLAEADGFGLISDGERFAVIQARWTGHVYSLARP